ncbi:MAG: efflux RND transporter permease subunit, partial [Flavobacteriales bacterium]|nr:efflux RND transporter permease subunit [Flavobacteriales bacterium]
PLDVTVILMMIFVLLFFAFRSILNVKSIFSAVPLATVGGVFALSLHGMEFNIGAGVGFITPLRYRVALDPNQSSSATSSD